MRVGVDVGGTNTDAVLINGKDILGAVKRPTRADVSEGIVDAIQSLIDDCSISAGDINSVMIGTTHFTNAFVQAKGLAKVFALRIGFPATRGIPPFSAWPQKMLDAVCAGSEIVKGGYEFDGRQINPLDEESIVRIAGELSARKVPQVAVSCVFSQLNSEHERRVADIFSFHAPEIGVSLSSELGRVGLLERENAAIMNASLRPLAEHVEEAFGEALKRLGINAPFFVSQNDGTLMKSSQMRRYPVLTFAAGPTNSLRGAAWLTGRESAIVVDIGGTTSDIGVLVNGFPRQSSVHVDVGGVRTNFRMPDILSIGLGGGSRVRCSGASVSVGPDSVGFSIHEDAKIFGGETLTASDIAVASGVADFGAASLVQTLGKDLVEKATVAIHKLVEDGVDRMKTNNQPVPMILVGGGAVLLSRKIGGVSEMIKPAHAGVANAIGAAIGQVSGEVDKIYNIADGKKQAALDDATKIATERAVSAGAAKDTIEIVNLEAIPLQYLPGGATRVLCHVVGDLKSAETHHGI